MDKKIIIIGRQFGSQGKDIAVALGKKLGIKVYDNELLSEAARKSGYSQDLFKNSDEKRRVFSVSNLFSNANRYSMGESYINDNALFKIQSEVIKAIADNESAIFVGRASDYVLRDMDCLSIFVCAPLDKRILTVSEREGISKEEAETMIRRKDKGRESFYNFFTFGNWGAASNYHLCIDSSILGVDGTADYIICFLNSKSKAL